MFAAGIAISKYLPSEEEAFCCSCCRGVGFTDNGEDVYDHPRAPGEPHNVAAQLNIVSRLTDIERKQDETTRFVQSAVETAEKASDTASQLKAEVSVPEEEIKRVQLDTKSTMARLQTDILQETANRISWEANVVLIGLDEPATDTDQTAIKTNFVQFAKKEMALEIKEEDIVETGRLGKQGGDNGKPRHRPRPLLVKFGTAHAKKEFTSARGWLKGKAVYQ